MLKKASPNGSTLCALLAAMSMTFANAAASELPTFQVVAQDGRRQPVRLEVPAGKKIKIQIRNDGPAPLEFENLDLRVERVLAPRASSFVVIHGLKPGSYRFFDEFHPDTSEMWLIAK